MVDFLRTAERMSCLLEKRIIIDWEVEKYPLFLKSAWMEPSSWELFKLKLKLKIVGAAVVSRKLKLPLKTQDEFESSRRFVMGFTGSSVAAGHDSLFVEAYPALINQTLFPVFSALGVDLDVRNVAVGNNPCVPYDACLKVSTRNLCRWVWVCNV
jgi:hypothetical protein